jgi:hypothetical protein
MNVGHRYDDTGVEGGEQSAKKKRKNRTQSGPLKHGKVACAPPNINVAGKWPMLPQFRVNAEYAGHCD